jgi:hypothetical protein
MNLGIVASSRLKITLTPFSSTSRYSTSFEACNATNNITYYHDGIAPNPGNGDTIYTNSSGTSVLVGVNRFYSSGTASYQVDNLGVVFNLQSC